MDNCTYTVPKGEQLDDSRQIESKRDALPTRLAQAPREADPHIFA